VAYDPADLISQAQKRKAQAEAADNHNREAAQRDLEFAVLKQWDQSLLDAAERETPPTPLPVLDRLTAFRNQVINEIRQAKPEPSVAPRGSGASKNTAKVIEGKVREILYDSDSDLAFIEAAKYAVASSRGVFSLDPEVVNEETGQQVPRVNPVWDPAEILTDPFAMKPDKSDAKWRLRLRAISRIEYKERWPNAKALAADFYAKESAAAGWMDPNSDKEAVMIAEYWCVEEIDKPNAVALGDDYEDDAKVWPDGKTYAKDRNDAFRKRQKERNHKHQVVCHFIDGVEELEPPVYRPGKIIPIFDVEGESYWVNKKHYTLSLTRPALDMQCEYNWLGKKSIEILGVQANAPYWSTPKQAEGHINQWNDGKSHFALLYNADPTSPGPPQRQQIDAPIEAITQAKAIKAQEMKDAIGLQDPNLSGAQSAQQSGSAIGQLITQGNTATFHFQDNLARTLKTFCKVLVEWIPFYYDVEEEISILNADMTKEKIMINTPDPYTDEETGKTYQHDLTKGNYEPIVDIGPSFATARKESANFYGNIVHANPEAFWLVGDLWVRAQDSAGSDEAADRIKRAIAMKMPGLIQDDPNQQLPAGANAQFIAMQGQLQQLKQVVQQQAMEIKMQAAPKMVEAQARIAIEDKKQQTAIKKALMDAEVALAKIRSDEAMHAKDHAGEMYATNLKEATDAIEHIITMLHESELAPGPDQGSQGLHPSAVPEPAAAAGGAE